MFNLTKIMTFSIISILSLINVASASSREERKDPEHKVMPINEEYNKCVQEVLVHYVEEKKTILEDKTGANKSGLLSQIEVQAKRNMTICSAKHPGSLTLTEETKKLLEEAGFTKAIHPEAF